MTKSLAIRNEVAAGAANDGAASGGAAKMAANGGSGGVADYLYVDAKDENQNRNRKRARRHHRWQWTRRLFVLLSAISIPAVPLFVGHGPVFAALPANLQMPAPELAFLVFMPAVQIAMVLWLAAYIGLTDHYWNNRRENIVQPLAQSKAMAFMEVMGIIDRTRFVSLASSLFGLSAVLSGAAMLAGSHLASQTINLSAGAQIGLGLIVARLGFELGRRYVQGSFLAQHVMILAIMSGQEKIGYEAARDRVKDSILQLISAYPYWFYFRKRQKHLSTD